MTNHRKPDDLTPSSPEPVSTWAEWDQLRAKIEEEHRQPRHRRERPSLLERVLGKR